MNEPFVFGREDESGPSHTGGTFLFQQNTIPGPEVDMQTDTTPKRMETGTKSKSQGLEDQENVQHDDSSSRRPLSQSDVLRVNRQRAANSKKPSSTSRRRKISLSRGIQGQNDDDENEDDLNVEWEDDEKNLPSTMRQRRTNEKERNRSLSKRVGDTLNIHYFFNGSQRNEGDLSYHPTNVNNHNGATTVRNWLDPEWCLGMAQFGFNATLLIGVIWILFNMSCRSILNLR